MNINNHFTTVSSHMTFTTLGVEHITTIDTDTGKVIYVVAMKTFDIIIHHQKFLDLMSTSCPMIIICDSNIDMPIKT